MKYASQQTRCLRCLLESANKAKHKEEREETKERIKGKEEINQLDKPDKHICVARVAYCFSRFSGCH